MISNYHLCDKLKCT